MKKRPSIAARAKEAVCPNCGGPVAPRGTAKTSPTFCAHACKIAFHNRIMAEGRAMAVFVKAWRHGRGTGEIAKAAFTQMCEMADLFNAEDLAAGRPKPDLYVAKILQSGTRFIDRQRRK